MGFNTSDSEVGRGECLQPGEGGGVRPGACGYFKKIFPFLLVVYEALLVCQASEKLIF